MSSFKESLINCDDMFAELFIKLHSAPTILALVLVGLQLARLLAVKLVEEELARRAAQPTQWGPCPECDGRVESKGQKPRQLLTLIGIIKWKRRCGRCASGCRIGQIAPLDQELGLLPNQKTCNSLRRVACALAVFVPFQIAAVLLTLLTGVSVSPQSIWNWVQVTGENVQQQLTEQINALAEGKLPDNIQTNVEQLLLAIGADGVMVPFRPDGGSPHGGTIWREVKVGIVAWLREKVTSTGVGIMRPVQRQVVAVLGSVDDLKPRLWLAALHLDILNSERVVWLCDGGRGFWRIFDERFSKHAQGILDFYHAAQNIWKATSKWLDGRTKRARNWFKIARRRLKSGEANLVLADIDAALQLKDLPQSARKSLQNLYFYLDRHIDHIDYARFKELGMPIGSGMVESTCKWLIQQRFKGVGMRWSEDGFNHLLHLRLAWVNGTFDSHFA